MSIMHSLVALVLLCLGQLNSVSAHQKRHLRFNHPNQNVPWAQSQKQVETDRHNSNTQGQLVTDEEAEDGDDAFVISLADDDFSQHDHRELSSSSDSGSSSSDSGSNDYYYSRYSNYYNNNNNNYYNNYNNNANGWSSSYSSNANSYNSYGTNGSPSSSSSYSTNDDDSSSSSTAYSSYKIGSSVGVSPTTSSIMFLLFGCGVAALALMFASEMIDRTYFQESGRSNGKRSKDALQALGGKKKSRKVQRGVNESIDKSTDDNDYHQMMEEPPKRSRSRTHKHKSKSKKKVSKYDDDETESHESNYEEKKQRKKRGKSKNRVEEDEAFDDASTIACNFETFQPIIQKHQRRQRVNNYQ